MPAYEYRCQACGHQFVEVAGISEHEKATPVCPRCRSADVERVFSEVFVKTSRKS